MVKKVFFTNKTIMVVFAFLLNTKLIKDFNNLKKLKSKTKYNLS